ncbi:L-threonylcarbamoyladenylate synthase [Nitrosopumilus sp.]|uniref:L-threonylcarbamoyladenylate synthase n=1 Tax=Nitrosopumilus sp. TaxID=2024843 RepID=UPI00261A7A00|nr:L-threonylcarbamoyladenylate synthase [Nitrosopumilus sp.]
MRVQCNDEGILKASEIIKNGGIAVYPTDTVYGIGCNPYLKESVDKIYKIKNRDRAKPLPLLVYSIEKAEEIVSFDEKTKKIIEKFWPGALTVLVKVNDQKLKESLEIEDKIAIRIPNSECILNLLEKIDFLVGTSANISGEKSFTDPKNCSTGLEDFEIFVDGGVIESKGESTIIEVTNDEIKVLREGAISKGEILSI